MSEEAMPEHVAIPARTEGGALGHIEARLFRPRGS